MPAGHGRDRVAKRGVAGAQDRTQGERDEQGLQAMQGQHHERRSPGGGC
jgi:hypothetical protein